MITLELSGLSCDHCVKAVREALAEVAGAEVVEVSLERATVSGHPDPQALLAAVVEEGYQAKLI